MVELDSVEFLKAIIHERATVLVAKYVHDVLEVFFLCDAHLPRKLSCLPWCVFQFSYTFLRCLGRTVGRGVTCVIFEYGLGGRGNFQGRWFNHACTPGKSLETTFVIVGRLRYESCI